MARGNLPAHAPLVPPATFIAFDFLYRYLIGVDQDLQAIEGVIDVPAPGSPPGSGTLTGWTYLKTTADVSTGSTGPVDIPDLQFTPGASKTYIVEGVLLLSSSLITSGAKPGINWPAGLLSGAAKIEVPNGANSTVTLHLNYGADGNAPGTDWPAADAEFLVNFQATFTTGASPSGIFSPTYAKE